MVTPSAQKRSVFGCLIAFVRGRGESVQHLCVCSDGGNGEEKPELVCDLPGADCQNDQHSGVRIMC